jgi:hypothetical protein
MRKLNIILGLAIALALVAILVPLGSVFLISVAVLVIPAAPLVAVAVLVASLVLAARGVQPRAASPAPVDALPQQCPLPRARARIPWRHR